MWVCRKHGKECKSYVKADMDILNADNVKPDDASIRKWYIAKYPHMKHHVEDEIRYIHKMLKRVI